MRNNQKYYIIDGDALPEVFLKVLEVNEHLLSGKIKNVSEATELVGISRSAYYKYKDKIKPFNQLASDTIVTFSCTLYDKSGVLSNILTNFAKCGANILTINQNIPSNGLAVVSISARTANMKYPIETLIKRAMDIDGVIKFDVLSSM
ncbi:MAG: ACT domain-containing protein [Clostridia bacterium]